MLKIKSFWKYFVMLLLKNKKKVIALLLVAIASTIYLGILKTESSNKNEEYLVVKKTLEEAVSLTGRVKPSEEANLSFEKTGVVRNVNVEVGQTVERGQIIASLSGESEYAGVLEAKAALLSQQALLEDLTTGAKAETIEIKKSVLDKTTSDLAQAYKNAGDSLRNIAISGNNFVRDGFSTSFSGSLNQGYKLNIASCDSLTENQVNTLRGEAEKALLDIEKNVNEYENLTNDTNRQIEILNNTKNIHMKKIVEYLDTLKTLFSSNCFSINSNYDVSRTTVTTFRNSWSSLNSDISTKINLINNGKLAVSQASNDLKISQNGEKSERVKQQEANVSAAFARLTLAQASSNKNSITAPFSGVITNIDIKAGELVSPGSKTISIMSLNNFEIESKVSEVDVTKLVKDAKAQITFDSYGDSEKFEAIVSNISPAGIISEGVPTYNTIFTFISKDEKIKSGMTANVKVITNKKENVVSIPAKFIKTVKGVKSVGVKVGNDVVEKVVTVGSLGVDGEIEIISGLSVNEVVTSL